MRLSGNIAIITGAAQGIGASIASRFVKSGAKVVLVDLEQKALDAVAETLRREGGVVETHLGDVSKKDQVQTVVNAVLKGNQRIDILVNNAGVIRDGFIGKLTEEDWDIVLDVNLKGTFFFCQAVFPSMKAQMRGKIVNISSRAWLGQSNYSASKGGVVSLTRTLALEFARFQINVNAVAPGLIDTPMTRSMPADARERLLRMQPTGKMGTVQDIAAAVEFLASNDAQFISGQVLHVDGGKSCGLLAL
jgi:NAD(P)-dependent dehydrogenase (short-subunit alcohol dehydrogenase family)